MLTGVILFLGENLEVAAGDGLRIAYKIMRNDFIVEGVNTAIIPSHVVELLEHLWKKAPGGATTVSNGESYWVPSRYQSPL